MLPRLPDLPDAAARAATFSPEQAAALQEQWRQAQAAQAALAGQEADRVAAARAGEPAPPPTITVTTRRAGASSAHARRAASSAIPRTGLAIFFLVHYGMFWLVHGIFVFALPLFAGGVGSVGTARRRRDFCTDPNGFPMECPSGAFGEVVWSSVLLGAVALFLSHGASFFLNYIGRGEYITASPSGQMGSVYGRVVILHLTIIFGSIVVAFLGAPIGALLVLVVLKTAFDLGLHLRERKRSGPVVASIASSAA